MQEVGMKIAAIVAAAGQGKRIGLGYNKTFMQLAGKTVLEYSIDSLRSCPQVVEIVVVVAQEEQEMAEELLNNNREPLKCRIVAGGSERQYSISNSLVALKSSADIILIHDGARPFLRQEMIMSVAAAARDFKAAILAVPVKDTIKAADAADFVTFTPERKTLWAVQTPQAFSAEILKAAYTKAKADGFWGTDDAALVERMGYKVKLVPGTYSNIKLTTPEDIIIAEALTEKESNRQVRVGFGYDVHQLAENRKLVLGGIKIPYNYGLAGHSDADVLLHAIKDALLGAAALEDIGRHFPDSEPKYKDISSLLLLAAVNEKLLAAGYKVHNVDAVIVAEKPKLAPYIAKMNENIAGVLKVKTSQINIKATTTEGLGFAGRKEGIAAYAVATICSSN